MRKHGSLKTSNTLLEIIVLPVRNPHKKLVPILAPMFRTESRYTSQVIVFRLKCEIWSAHETVSE